MWKKLTIVVSAAFAAAVAMSLLSDAKMNLLVAGLGALATVAAVVWVVAKVLGVRLDDLELEQQEIG